MDEQKKTSGSLALNSTPQVITIPPSDPVRVRKLRVAAYARVSSSSEDQLNSFAAQNAHYQRGVWSMKKILFVCHGNICRSPMAEYVMKDLVKKSGLEEEFQIASAATSREEIGNPVYPPARRKLAEHGIPCESHAARQLRNHDYEEYDLIIGMDKANLRSMYRICGGDFNDKMHLLMEYAGRPGQEVADPWYTGDFDTTWRDVLEGYQGLLDHLKYGE